MRPDGVAEGADFYIPFFSINSNPNEYPYMGYGYGEGEGKIPSVPTAFLEPMIRVASWVKLETYFSCCDSVSLVW